MNDEWTGYEGWMDGMMVKEGWKEGCVGSMS